MCFYKVFFNITLLSACAHIASMTQAANNEAASRITRHLDSYQKMDDEHDHLSELRKDFFLNDQLLPNIILYSDPVSYFNAGEVCKDWQSICQNRHFMKTYLNKSFKIIKSKVSTADNPAEKFAKLFVEIELAKVIEYHRPRFPYTQNSHIADLSLIRTRAMMNSTQRNLQRHAQRRQIPAQAVIPVLPLNNGAPLPFTVVNAHMLNFRANRLNQVAQAAGVNQAAAANQQHMNPPESYLKNVEEHFKRVLDRLNPRGVQIGAVGQVLTILGNIDDLDDGNNNDHDMGLGLGIIAAPNQEQANERNLLTAKEEFEGLCDRTIPAKLRELSNNHFELLNTNPTMHSILLQGLADEIRNSPQFRAYVQHKATSYRTIYRTINQINSAPEIKTLSSTELPENESEDNYLIMLKQIFDKTLTGE